MLFTKPNNSVTIPQDLFLISSGKDKTSSFFMWLSMLQREGRGSQIPYPSLFESIGIKADD